MNNLVYQMDRVRSNLVLSHTVYLSGKELGSETHSMMEKKQTKPFRVNGTNQTSYF